MGAPRRFAAALMRGALKAAPESSREWASAMLHELDFIPGEWAALYWALGSVGAILRHAGGAWRQWFTRLVSNQEERMNPAGKKAVGVISGMVSALMLVACTFGLLRLTEIFFPNLGLSHMKWAYWFSVLVLPEAIFIGAAIVMWRKRGPIAAGILLFAAAMGLHIAIHVATH